MLNRTFSHYRVIGEIGKGGMGVVYLAEDTILHRKVAVKFPVASVSRNRLLDEARAASGLVHPAIAGIYDCGEADGAPYIVMEYVEGTTLSDELRGGPLPVGRAVRIVTRVLEALAEAHRCHIIHRDIKPANIRTDARGGVKVLDFGLAKLLNPDSLADMSVTRAETRTADGIIRGTPQYMSPEQARGEASDERTDVFAAGIVLYECLTGQSPFAGETAMDGLANVLQRDPPPPSVLNPQVPPAIDRVVRKALEKDRSQRYASAAAMLEDLAAAPLRTDSLTIAARPLLRRLHTGPVRWMSTGGAIAVLTVAIVWGVRGWRHHTPNPDVQRWYLQGVTALRDGTYYTAAKMLERAVTRDPGFAAAQARLAEAYNELEDVTRAQQAMLRAMAAGTGSLPRVEEQAIRAVSQTLTNDFEGAAVILRGLLQAADEQERGALSVDLGRALERAQKGGEALAAYQEATRRAPDLAAGWMRLGVLSGRRQDLAVANTAFDRAESLYRTLGNVEGLAEVVYQRGMMAERAGKTDEAVPLLERARQMAEASGNPHQAIAVLFGTSLARVRKGDIGGAEAHGAEALELARRNGLELLTASGLVTLGNAFHVRGDTVQAERYFTQALEAARRFNAKRTEARALLSLGSLHYSTADFDRSLKEVEQAKAFYDRGGYEKERSLALTLLGRVFRDRGDFAGATKVFQEQMERARQGGDTAQQATAHEGLAQCAYQQSRYPEALPHCRERIAISRTQGSLYGQAYGLMALSTVLARLGRFDEAAAGLAEARAIAAKPGGAAGLKSQLDLTSASVALVQRQHGRALSLIREILPTLAKLPLASQSAYWRIRGAAETGTGAAREGERSTRTARDIARKSGMAGEISVALLAHAEALLSLRNRGEAVDEARMALDECARSGRAELEAEANLILARASPDAETARTFAQRTLVVLKSLEQLMGPEYQRSFLSRPDVRLWRREAQALTGQTGS